MMVVL